MKSTPSSAVSLISRLIPLSLVIGLFLLATTGCGTGPSESSVPKLSGNTSVNLVLSSAADDQLNRFDIELKTLTLTSQSGKTVNLLSAEQGLEFIHVNGTVEPLLTISIPQDIYTAASATVGTAEFTCLTITPTGSLDTSIFGYGQTPDANVTVNFPSPTTITGKNMTLALEMLVSQSAALSSCYDPHGSYTYSITPTFSLAPLSLAAQPTTSRNGKVSSLDGEVISIDAANNNFQLSPGQDFYLPTSAISIKSNSATVYQGVSGLSQLSVGSLIELDGAIQADGSTIATRIAALDADTAILSMQTGPVIQTNSAVPVVFAFGRRQQGHLYDIKQAAIWMPFDYGSTLFQISGQFTNLQNLPFVPSFNGTNMVDGQNVYVTTHAPAVTINPYPSGTTITLVPQTIHGTVNGSSQSGAFTVYTISLAADDLFPALAVQPGQPIRLNNPSQVEVYVDSNTQKVNKTPLVPGSTLRFYGLVFNDNGTLQMDCGEVSDGAVSASSAGKHQESGRGQTLGSKGAGQKEITTIIQSH